MSKHTPGPWTADLGGMDAKVVCPDGRYFTIGDIVYHDENRANASMISAAPELLEALSGALKAYETRGTLGKAWWTKTRAAISKAEGK